MDIEVYAVAKDKDTPPTEADDLFGPYGYPTQLAAYEAAKERAQGIRGQVIAYTFTFEDSELVDDFTGEGSEEG